MKADRSALPAPDALPLREVVVQFVAKCQQVNVLDDQIARAISKIEHEIRSRRPDGRPVDVPFAPWGKLGWSGRRGRWRLVVVDEDACEDLNSMPQLCRLDACRVLGKLVERLELASH